MQRVVTAEMDLELGASVDLIFQIAAAQAVPISSEQLTFTQGDRVYTPTEIVDQSGSRLHRLTGEPGRLEIRYEATVDGQAASSRSISTSRQTTKISLVAISPGCRRRVQRSSPNSRPTTVTSSPNRSPSRANPK